MLTTFDTALEREIKKLIREEMERLKENIIGVRYQPLDDIRYAQGSYAAYVNMDELIEQAKTTILEGK